MTAIDPTNFGDAGAPVKETNYLVLPVAQFLLKMLTHTRWLILRKKENASENLKTQTIYLVKSAKI